jgi:thiamine biosynthesis lipoprotein
MDELRLERAAGHWAARFQAMASPCEVLIDGDDASAARHIGTLVQQEALRIERKFSRYRENSGDDSVVARINRADGATIEVDEETAALLDYAQACTRISDGGFDITSGVLRQAWRFDGSDRLADPQHVQSLLARVGWQRVVWQAPHLKLEPGMQIDLGGIGKEYAVDRAAGIIRALSPVSVLVNFGGDLVSSGPRADGSAWMIGIEDPRQPATAGARCGDFALARGAAATSGDTFRYLVKDGRRYSHVLDARTGWPVEQAPHSITVLAPTCIEAGTLATLAMIQGAGAERFLDAQGVKYWCRR